MELCAPAVALASQIRFTGNYDILVKARAKDIDALNKLIQDRIREIKGIDKSKTMIVIEEMQRE